MCKHESFACSVEVGRITNEAGDVVERYQANVRVTCDQCQMVFRFIGLPAGLDLNGAAVSVDGAEGRFTIAPKGEVLSELEGAVGFTVKRTDVASENALRFALGELVKLQSHYADLLNQFDGGQRHQFASADEWVARLKELGRLPK